MPIVRLPVKILWDLILLSNSEPILRTVEALTSPRVLFMIKTNMLHQQFFVDTRIINLIFIYTWQWSIGWRKCSDYDACCGWFLGRVSLSPIAQSHRWQHSGNDAICRKTKFEPKKSIGALTIINFNFTSGFHQFILTFYAAGILLTEV